MNRPEVCSAIASLIICLKRQLPYTSQMSTTYAARCDVSGEFYMIQDLKFSVMLLPMVTTIGDVRELERWDNTPFIDALPHELVLMNSTGKRRASGKKTSVKRFRTAFTAQQILALEASFKRRRYIQRDERAELARDLNLPDKQIKVWFQNRRMKQKRENTHGSATDSSCSSSADSTCAVGPVNFTSELKNPSNNTYFDSMVESWRDYPQFRTGMEPQQEDVYVFPKPISLDHSINYQNTQGSEFLMQSQKVQSSIRETECIDGCSFQTCMSLTSQFHGKIQYSNNSEPHFQNYGAYETWSFPQVNSYHEIY